MAFWQAASVVLVLLGSIAGALLARSMEYGTVGVVCGAVVGFVLVHVTIAAVMYVFWTIAARDSGGSSDNIDSGES